MDKILLVPTLKDEITANSAWCSSFSLAWKELQNEYLENNFKYNKNNQTITNLIAESKANLNVNEKDYYVKSGRKTPALKKEIEKAIKKKFNTKSDILKEISFDKDAIDILIYSIIKFNLEFPKKFEKFSDKMLFGDLGKNPIRVSCFGIENTENYELYFQTHPLFYNSENDFALSLDSKDEKKIILYRTDGKVTFEEAYKQIKDKTQFQNIEVHTVAIPDLSINLFERYEELAGESLIRVRDNQEYMIAQAMQTLQFDLGRAGAKVKSESAIIGIKGSRFNPNRPTYVDFIFNNTFYLFIEEKDSPVVALRVQDIKEFI